MRVKERKELCPSCGGKRSRPGAPPCKTCNGEGFIPIKKSFLSNLFSLFFILK